MPCWKARATRIRLDYDDVTAFAARAGQLEHLDMAILNACIYKIKMTINPSTGNEEDIQTSFLSTYLLANLLLPVLQAKKPSPTELSRLTIVSSDTVGMTSFVERDADPLLAALKDTRGKWKWDMQERYGTSKLLGQMFLDELAARVPPSEVIITASDSILELQNCRFFILVDGMSFITNRALHIIIAILPNRCSYGILANLDESRSACQAVKKMPLCTFSPKTSVCGCVS
jgi:hypothetical protein